MKISIKKLLILLLAISLLVPNLVFAATNDRKIEVEKTPVVVYMFYGDGCPHCAEAEEWFNSDEIQEEYGKYFTMELYEVWYDANNKKLMSAVSDARSDNATGVPYIIIGNQSYKGFADYYKEDILNTIMEEYEKDESKRINVVPDVIDKIGWEAPNVEMEATKKTKNYNSIVGLSSVLLIVGVAAIIIYARKED